MIRLCVCAGGWCVCWWMVCVLADGVCAGGCVCAGE